jgi:flavin reductase (DIM6/NTAB) family NADH-FMN oxidoreductase RutF
VTELWKKLTSTVGLVAVSGPHGVNVLACEWSYLVNKDPLYVAVVLGPRTASRPLIAAAGRFAVTFCADDQAELADFAGSCSVTDVDKATSEAFTFGRPTITPWVTGGVLAVECELRQTVPMPVHTMYVGEVVAAHEPDRPRRPLVKHGAMYTLGAPVERTAAVTATRVDAGRLRVAATGPGTGPWRLDLVGPDGTTTGLGQHQPDRFGDLLVAVPLTEPVAPGARLRVERDGAKPGYAVVAP